MSRTLLLFTLVSALLVSYNSSASNDCDVKLSEQKIDNGHFSFDQLQLTSNTLGFLSMGTRIQNLSSTCGVDTIIGLSFDGVAHSEKGYQFAQNGKFTLKIISAQLDGRAVEMRTLDRTATDATDDWIRPGEKLLPFDGQHVAKGERLNVKIEVHTFIHETESRVVNDQIVEGRGSFKVQAM